MFGAGEYAPETPVGRTLLAHELTHTIQQGGSAPVHGMPGAVRTSRTGGRRVQGGFWDDVWSGIQTVGRAIGSAFGWVGDRIVDAANWAADLLRELVRTSRNLVFVAMPNNIQVGYWMRKLVIDRDFFTTHDEGWTDMTRIRHILEDAGVTIFAEGVLDVPPWPDTVMPANEVLKRLGIRSKALDEQFTGEGWQWSTMAWYMDKEPELRARVMRYAWLDHAALPWQAKAIWAHHRYLLGTVR